jgi:hypothetical protein
MVVGSGEVRNEVLSCVPFCALCGAFVQVPLSAVRVAVGESAVQGLCQSVWAALHRIALGTATADAEPDSEADGEAGGAQPKPKRTPQDAATAEPDTALTRIASQRAQIDAIERSQSKPQQPASPQGQSEAAVIAESIAVRRHRLALAEAWLAPHLISS